ncbi:MAG: hypothetical protein JWQ50_1263 [Caballeronia mineralivorans]|jgi:hypothetical protein|nr:hypothetical protein [Caballeronia mineralivorans]
MKPQTIAAAPIAVTLAASAFADANHDRPESFASSALLSATSASPPTSNATAPTAQPPQQGKTRALSMVSAVATARVAPRSRYVSRPQPHSGENHV